MSSIFLSARRFKSLKYLHLDAPDWTGRKESKDSKGWNGSNGLDRWDGTDLQTVSKLESGFMMRSLKNVKINTSTILINGSLASNSR